jgi:hypothetical protein
MQKLYLFKSPLVKTAIITILPLFNTFYFASMLSIFFLSLINFSKELKILILGFSSIFIVNYIGWIYSHVRAKPVKDAAIFIKKQKISNIITYHMNTPSFNVYSQIITKKSYPKIGNIVLTNVQSLKRLKHYKILFKEGTVVIVKIVKPCNKTEPFNYKREKR